jgi:DNA-binding beta-propeller fold protein YncE
VAGNGKAGSFPGLGTYSGDGGPATLAGLGRPSGIALDQKGNLYIADEDNGRVRVVTADGMIKTVVGGQISANSQGPNPAALAFDQAGNLFIADNAGLSVWEVTGVGTITKIAGRGFPPGDSPNCSPARSAAFGQALGIAVDRDENIYIADAAKDKVRMITRDGLFSTVAGTGVHGAFGPVGMVGDGGPATGAALGGPPAVAVDKQGDLYIADEANMRVRKVIQPRHASGLCG